jgi:hypothetical protein
VKLFAIIAAVALAVAAMFFLSYSVEHGWLEPPVRVAIGSIVGIAILVGCELKMAQRYTPTANALDAAGAAILFGTFWAAYTLWHLVPAAVGFALLVIVTAVTVMLSIRRNSVFIALLGLVGGFATPAILATGQDSPIGLFGYLLLLNAGLAWVAYKKSWPLLTALSLVFTTLYQWGWVSRFLTATKLPLAAAIFLIFPILSFVAFALGRRSADLVEGRWSKLFGHAARVGAVLPLLFSVYLAAVPAYGARYGVLFGFLLILDVGLFAVAAFSGPRTLHVLGALSTLIVFAVWLSGSYDAGAWPGIIAFIALFVCFYLTAPLALRLSAVRRRAGEIELGEYASRAVLAAPLLLFVFPVLAGIEPRAASPWLLFGSLLALVAACAWYALTRAEGIVHFLAAFFAIAAEAVWSSRHLSPDRLFDALAIYGVFGLFYVGVPVIARLRGKPLQPQGAGGVVTLVSVGLLFFLAGGSVAQAALWGIAVLIAVLNVGLYIESSAARVPVLALAGALLSWMMLAVWWSTATVAIALVPALSVVTGFALLTLAGSVWARRREVREESGEEQRWSFAAGGFVALIGHLFLAFVATQSRLSIPPGPMLAILGVLTLAFGVAALYTRDGQLFLGGMVAAALVIVVWQFTAEAAPWPTVAILAAGALVALGGAWTFLARRIAADPISFDRAATVGGFLAQCVATIAVVQSGAPSLTFLLVAQLVFLAATLGFATLELSKLEGFTALAVIPAAVAGFLFEYQSPRGGIPNWTDQLAFITPIYLAFIAYPLLLGRRAGAARAPYVAVVLASTVYFFQARVSLLAGGYGGVIGALPVVEAGLISLVLAQLVRLERARGGVPRTSEELTRLALIAGAALGFITVAIPLQLQRNWITIGWALEGAALAWLYRRIPHKGLLLFAGSLLAVVFVRLAMNPSVLTYEPRGVTRVWNWYLYTYLLCAAALAIAGRFLATTDDVIPRLGARLSALLPGGAAVMLFLLLNIEIADFYAIGPTITFNFTAGLAQDLTYTLGWAVFAVALLGVGIMTHSRAGRMAAIGLIAAATVKCALHDLWRLGGLYRVGSLVGLAICLFLITLALQKFVLAARPQPQEALS